ncbi:MAG: ferrous iron transporter B [Defluviitaleaceae bacterium]|nr:ferrous iron transporter B [Defluviitaleaceae bacterium]
MSCHDVKMDDHVLEKTNKILLMGNPNVGKSIFFTKLTGIHAMSSNYAGTTVTFTEGRFTIGDKAYTLIDVPGTYSMNPTSEAEAVALRFMESGASAIICVLNASSLERNLTLAMEITKYNIPVIYTLNMMDVAKRHGVHINIKQLEHDLGAPVIETVAVKGRGLDELVNKLEVLLGDVEEGCYKKCHRCEGCPWTAAKEINNRVSTRNNPTPSFLDRLGDSMLKPFPGLPIALLILAILVIVVAFGGRGLRVPLIMLTDNLIIPFFRRIFEGIFAFFVSDGGQLSYNFLYYDNGFQTGLRILVDGTFQTVAVGDYAAVTGFASMLLNILIGEYGIFVISFQWIIALIFPYVLAFYIAITFLEDSGYLPRVSVLFDNIMRKLGVQGGSLIHVFLALGCAVPAILGSRTATTKKERLMIVAIVCFTIPCISQIGALIALMSAFSWWMTPLMVLFAICLFIVVAFTAGKILKGKVDPLILEVPNLLIPEPKAYFRKLMARMKHFLRDAEFPMLIAVLISALLAGTGVIGIIAQNSAVQYVVSSWLGMPEEAVISLILGIVRREMSVAPLLLLNLTHLQAFVAGVVSLMYLPCLSVFGIVAKEFKIRVALTIFLGTIVSAIFVGGLINQIANLFI